MPRFKTTENILIDKRELFDNTSLDSHKLELPPYTEWDNSRELQIEDIDVWEVLSEISGPSGVYASWLPYAEFYMIVHNDKIDSTYYGQGSDKYAAQRCEELKIPYPKK
jgi:hypothetical protein